MQNRLRMQTAGIAFWKLDDRARFQAERSPVLLHDGDMIIEVVFGVELEVCGPSIVDEDECFWGRHFDGKRSEPVGLPLS